MAGPPDFVTACKGHANTFQQTIPKGFKSYGILTKDGSCFYITSDKGETSRESTLQLLESLNGPERSFVFEGKKYFKLKEDEDQGIQTFSYLLSASKDPDDEGGNKFVYMAVMKALYIWGCVREKEEKAVSQCMGIIVEHAHRFADYDTQMYSYIQQQQNQK